VHFLSSVTRKRFPLQRREQIVYFIILTGFERHIAITAAKHDNILRKSVLEVQQI